MPPLYRALPSLPSLRCTSDALANVSPVSPQAAPCYPANRVTMLIPPAKGY